VTEQLLEALFQFEVAPSVYLKDIIPPDSLSLKYTSMFDLTGKRNSMWLNTWFLHSFGYKRCSACKEIIILDSYSYNSNSADKLQVYCKNCNSKDGKDYRATNPDKSKEKGKAYRLANPEKSKESSRAYRIANPEKTKESSKKYTLANPDKINALTAKRRANKLLATPTWLTKEQLRQILEFYTEAKRLEQETGIKYHVDHIVPLQGLSVCGLHVPWNLQILTAKENVRKSNKWPS
jgi:hypothetical protein